MHGWNKMRKATSYLIEEGFSDVHHLEGGILKYLEDVSSENSLWNGECFVFDQRVSLDHELLPVHIGCVMLVDYPSLQRT